MALGTKTLTGNSSTELLAADVNRDYVLIQLQSDHQTYVGFGETAVNLQGIGLLEPGAWVKATGHKARGVINVINADSSAVIGYETQQGIECGIGVRPFPSS
ncbi:hypothetical protein LCGC14_2515690 [marine sediment metagenome]|uniref:Uncharacterized protein n=1 Tax=marine sediment metagenome TaxID=412755 RepID=A0A0F9D9F4_9ZZZZ